MSEIGKINNSDGLGRSDRRPYFERNEKNGTIIFEHKVTVPDTLETGRTTTNILNMAKEALRKEGESPFNYEYTITVSPPSKHPRGLLSRAGYALAGYTVTIECKQKVQEKTTSAGEPAQRQDMPVRASQTAAIPTTDRPSPPANAEASSGLAGQAEVPKTGKATSICGDPRSDDHKQAVDFIMGFGIKRDRAEEIARITIEESGKMQIDHRIPLAIMAIESKFNANALNKNSGCAGIMQLGAAAAKDVGMKSSNERYEISKAIPGGIKYLVEICKLHTNGLDAVAKYNAGPNKKNLYSSQETRAYIIKFHDCFNSLAKGDLETAKLAASRSTQTAANEYAFKYENCKDSFRCILSPIA